MDTPLISKYLNKDNTINTQFLSASAKKIKHKILNLNQFAKQFNADPSDTISITPNNPNIPKIICEIRTQFHKLNPRYYKEDRRALAQTIKSTIQDPDFVVKHNNAIKFFKAYKTRKEEIYHIAVAEKVGEDYVLKSNYRPIKKQGNKVKVSWGTIKKLVSVKSEDIIYEKKHHPSIKSKNYSNTKSIEKGDTSDKSIADSPQDVNKNEDIIENFLLEEQIKAFNRKNQTQELLEKIQTKINITP